MLKNPLTYEIMRPETVGVPESRLVLGKHSGRHAFRVRLEQMGYHLSPEAFEEAFRRFKALCDRKKYVTDFDLEALMADFTQSSGQTWRLDTLQVMCGTPAIATATVRLIGPDGEVRLGTGTGNGPVDAAYRAIEAALGVQARLLEFNVHAVTPGRDAMGRVFVQAEDPQSGELAGGFGADTDIVVAAAKAYLNALLRLARAPQGARVELSVPVP
jgi:2-isopropylmalate synthase